MARMGKMQHGLLQAEQRAAVRVKSTEMRVKGQFRAGKLDRVAFMDRINQLRREAAEISAAQDRIKAMQPFENQRVAHRIRGLDALKVFTA